MGKYEQPSWELEAASANGRPQTVNDSTNARNSEWPDTIHQETNFSHTLEPVSQQGDRWEESLAVSACTAPGGKTQHLSMCISFPVNCTQILLPIFPLDGSIPTDLWEFFIYWDNQSFTLRSITRIFRRRQWHPTPVLLPAKSHGWRSLVGCSPWGR